MALLLAGCSPAGKGSLAIAPPADWQVEHQRPGNLEFYSVTAKSPDEGLLMFSQWPPPSAPAEIPGLVQRLADGFIEQARKTGGFPLTSEKYMIEQFVGNQCSGSYVTFRIKGTNSESVQAMFMMNVDGRIWNGQFTGKPEAWAEALELLRTIRKKG